MTATRRWAVLVLLATSGIFLSGCGLIESNAVPAVPGGNQQRGRMLVAAYGCVTCHDIPDAPNRGSVGPPLRGVGGRAYVAGRLPNTPENMIRWIRNPRDVDDGTVMPDMGVTEQDARDIAALLYRFRR